MAVILWPINQCLNGAQKVSKNKNALLGRQLGGQLGGHSVYLFEGYNYHRAQNFGAKKAVFEGIITTDVPNFTGKNGTKV